MDMSIYKGLKETIYGSLAALLLFSSGPALGDSDQKPQYQNVNNETPVVKKTEEKELPRVDKSFELEMDRVDREPEKVEIYEGDETSLVKFSGLDRMNRQYEKLSDSEEDSSITFKFPSISESEILQPFTSSRESKRPSLFFETDSGNYTASWNPFKGELNIDEVDERPPGIIQYTIGLFRAASKNE